MIRLTDKAFLLLLHDIGHTNVVSLLEHNIDEMSWTELLNRIWTGLTHSELIFLVLKAVHIVKSGLACFCEIVLKRLHL